MKCPKKHLKEDFVMWWHLHFYFKCPNIEGFQFRRFFCFKTGHMLLIRNSLLFMLEKFFNAPFSHNIIYLQQVDQVVMFYWYCFMNFDEAEYRFKLSCFELFSNFADKWLCQTKRRDIKMAVLAITSCSAIIKHMIKPK